MNYNRMKCRHLVESLRVLHGSRNHLKTQTSHGALCSDKGFILNEEYIVSEIGAREDMVMNVSREGRSSQSLSNYRWLSGLILVLSSLWKMITTESSMLSLA